MKKPQKVLYLCDGEVEGCKKHSCYKNNGRCNYTSDIMHAKNFHKIDAPYSVFYENKTASGETTAAIRVERKQLPVKKIKVKIIGYKKSMKKLRKMRK